MEHGKGQGGEHHGSLLPILGAAVQQLLAENQLLHQRGQNHHGKQNQRISTADHGLHTVLRCAAGQQTGQERSNDISKEHHREAHQQQCPELPAPQFALGLLHHRHLTEDQQKERHTHQVLRDKGSRP